MSESFSSMIVRAAGGGPALRLADASFSVGENLVDRILADFERRWQAGEQPRPEEYLARHPELNEQPAAVMELIYEEIFQRRMAGDPAAEQELIARFPCWREEVQKLFECQRLLGENAAPPRFPEIGERLGDFVFLAELGRGVQGRVFLAEQPSLANRPIVLKLAPPRGSEHLCLARLQHTHIVPLYSVTDFPPRGLRGICLPYFGGATLARVLDSLSGQAPAQRKAADIVSVVQRAADELPLPPADSDLPNASPALKFLERASYVQAICWLGACLADALNEAHARGLAHLDLKPSNVLWAGDGQPMLLDFHLAREPIAADAPAPEWLGGTPGYMPPEQLAALEAVRRGERVEAAVDGRADIYALGRVLSEALAGRLPPEDVNPADWLRRANPNVSIGLADLIAKCLTREPGDRYSGAAALAADLRRHLDDLPLVSVKNRSWTERWNKWRRRRPHALLVFLLAVAAVGGAALIVKQLRQQVGQAEVALQEGRKLIAERRYAEARSTLRQGIYASSSLYSGRRLTEELEAELQIADQAYAARELHEFVEATRVLCGADGLNAEKLRLVDLRAANFWNRRRELLERPADAAMPELMRRLRRDFMELAIISAWIRAKSASVDEQADVHRECLQMLADAEALAGPSCAIWYARRVHAAALGLDDLARQAQEEAEAMPPSNAWEYTAAGQSLSEEGRLEQAYALFEKATQQEPQSLWAHFCLGRSAYELGRYADALASFTACTALAPNSALCFAKRGQVLFQLGRYDQARRDLDRALALDPFTASASLCRGRLNLQAQRWSDAEGDFRAALANGADKAAANYGLAAAELELDDRASAREHFEAGRQIDSARPEAATLRQALDRTP